MFTQVPLAWALSAPTPIPYPKLHLPFGRTHHASPQRHAFTPAPLQPGCILPSPPPLPLPPSMPTCCGWCHYSICNNMAAMYLHATFRSAEAVPLN